MPSSLIPAGMLGTAAGMRTMTPAAVLAGYGGLSRSRRLNTAVLLAAVGELIGDKLPTTPSRTTPMAVVGRIGAGAICGRNVSGPLGAAAAGVGAGVSTFLMHDLRAAAVTHTGLPDLPFALLEDVLAIGLSFAAIGLIGRTGAGRSRG